MHSYREQASVPNSPLPSASALPGTRAAELGTLDPLLRAAELTLYRRINSIINMLPVPHQVVSCTHRHQKVS